MVLINFVPENIVESSQQDTTKGRGGHDDESGLGVVHDGHGGGGHHDDDFGGDEKEEEKEEKKSLKARLQAVQEVTALVQVIHIV